MARLGSNPPMLEAKRDAPVGGQAVLEGVMMRGVSTWAVAVRQPDEDGNPKGEIKIESFDLKPWSRRHRVWRLPVIRGVVALVESMGIGFKALNFSANEQLGEEEEPISGGLWGLTIAFSMLIGIGLFFVVPVFLTSLIKDQLGSSLLFWIVEGILRTGILLVYLSLLSRSKDLRRVFEYHGAEHKVISCYEAEDELTPERAALYSRFHPRCGTSFLLVVAIVAIFVFAPLGLPAWYFLLASRIIGIPLIVGLSFEVIKWAGRHRSNKIVKVIIWPGIQLQRLTTREPDLDQLAVSIASMKAVIERDSEKNHTADDLIGVEVAA